MKSSLRGTIFAVAGVLAIVLSASANIPGGGNGTGPSVTLVNNGNGTVTMANGIVSIVCLTSGGSITQINYTYNNGGGTVTRQLLSGGTQGGKLYWENSTDEGLTFSYSVVVDPSQNGGNYAEIALTTTSVTNDVLEVHYAMLRGSTGFYVIPIWSHTSTDAALSMGECRDNIYAGAIFNWMCVDATRNRLMAVQTTNVALAVFGAPQEVTLWTNGIYQGRYEDKYKYSADFGEQRVWGWCNVGAGAGNVGLWNVSASVEYYNGGPMKRELMEHIGTTILNMHNGSHYGGGTDGTFAAGELWTKVYGPYLIYCNNVTNTLTATNQAAQALYQDALAQGAAEAPAWPYSWFTNANYAAASSRGSVSGQIVINDAYITNASASNLWVGVVLQPSTSTSDYDFQEWMKPYQFWVKTDTNGNFTISNVIAGANYTLYAFGPGAAGTFQSQAQSGGAAPNELDIPAVPFSVTVTAGATNELGAVVWTPMRVGSTVFEIGYPDRTASKFRHGEDWWVGDIGPDPNDPSPIWTKFLEYPFDFPSGPNYTVGQSRWTTDWNFIQPVVTDFGGNYNGSTSTITFNLAQAPTNGAQACLYLALASDYQGALIVQVNGNNIAGSTGYFPAYNSSANESDASIREGIHGIFSDNRIAFAGSLLRQGQNTITINMRKGGYFANHAMYDYIRLELQGYVPPPPASVTVYPGNNCNLVCWPVTPGAASYNILRSMTSGSGYISITNGVTGPVCGSGFDNATFLDTSAANGVTYYYVVQSENSVGTSANSSQSSSATPSTGFSTSPPASPASLVVASSGHQNVALSWSASSGANFYTIQRSTLFDNGGGVSNVLGTITLHNNITGTSYIDTSPTDGSIYSYTVSATSAGGTSGNSSPAVAVPLPAPPASPPANILVKSTGQTNYLVSWSPVPGAVGYIVRRGTNSRGPFNFVMSITETNWIDNGLNSNTQYFYTITAVNAAGVATSAISGGSILSWTGASNSIWDTKTTNWLNGLTPAVYADGDVVTFNDTAVSANVMVSNSVFPASVTFSNAAISFVLSTSVGGAGISGSTSLAKGNSGNLTLASPNAYTGGTTISGGSLQVNSANGSGTGSGAVTVASGGMLAGGGIVAGPVTVNSGGALAPTTYATLTLSNSLTLGAGSTTFLQVQHSPSTNNSVNVSGTLAEGGTLNVTNTGTTAFTVGDSFKLFKAGTYSGTFAGFVLPALSNNLVWNTNSLDITGTLSVAVRTSPSITSVRTSGGNLIFSGSGGVSYWPYYLLATTNLTSPVTQWTPIATNQFDASGDFSLTNSINPNWPQAFYGLQLE